MRHRLWRVTDPSCWSRLTDGASAAPGAVIADGHHRFAAARAQPAHRAAPCRQRRRARAGHPHGPGRPAGRPDPPGASPTSTSTPPSTQPRQGFRGHRRAARRSAGRRRRRRHPPMAGDAGGRPGFLVTDGRRLVQLDRPVGGGASPRCRPRLPPPGAAWTSSSPTTACSTGSGTGPTTRSRCSSRTRVEEAVRTAVRARAASPSCCGRRRRPTSPPSPGPAPACPGSRRCSCRSRGPGWCCAPSRTDGRSRGHAVRSAEPAADRGTLRPRRQFTSQTDAVPVPVRQNRRCSAPSTSTTSPGCHSGRPALQRPVVGDAGQHVDRLPARPRLRPAHHQPEGQQGVPARQGADLRRGGHPPAQHHVVPVDHSHAHAASLRAAGGRPRRRRASVDAATAGVDDAPPDRQEVSAVRRRPSVAGPRPAAGVGLTEELGDLGLDLVLVEAAGRGRGRPRAAPRRPRGGGRVVRRRSSAVGVGVVVGSASSSASSSAGPRRPRVLVRPRGRELDPQLVELGELDGVGQLIGVGGGDRVEPLLRPGPPRPGPRAGRRTRRRGAAGRSSPSPATPASGGRRARPRARAARRRPRRGRGGRRPRRCASSAGLLRVGRLGQGLRDQPERDLGPAERPLAVGEDGAVALVAAHPPVGAELAGGLGVVTGVVGGDADGLADDGDAGRAVAGGPGMGERGLRVLVDQRSGGDEVAGDLLGVPGVEPPQGTADGRVEVTRVDPLGDVRARRQRRTAIGPVVRLAGRPGGRPRDAGPASCRHRRRTACRPVHAGHGHPAAGHPDGRRSCQAAPAGRSRWGRSPCGRSPAGRRSCQPPPAEPPRCGRSPRAVTRDGGPATAGRRPRCGRSPAGGHPRTTVLPLPAAPRCGRSPCGRSPGGRRSCQPPPCEPRAADGHRAGGHPRDGGPASRRLRADRCGRSPVGRSPGGRRSCQPPAEPPRCGRSPCGRSPRARSCQPPPAEPPRCGTVTLRTAVLPAAAGRAAALRAVTLRTVTGGGGPASRHRPGGHAADGRPADGHPRATVLPLRPITRRAVTLRTTVLPLRPVTAGGRCGRSCHCGRPRSGGHPAATVLPLRPVTRGATVLPTAAGGVLPLRTVTRGTVTLRPAVLPAATLRARTLGTVTLRTVARGRRSCQPPRSSRDAPPLRPPAGRSVGRPRPPESPRSAT